MEKYFIGVDIGTGSTKAVAINLAGHTLGVSQVAYSTFSSGQGFSEQDPEEVWQAFVRCLRQLTGQVVGTPQCVSLSSAMHSLLAVGRDGEPMTRAMTWADSRAASIAELLKNSPLGEPLYNATGTPVHSISLLAKIIWLKENAPDIYWSANKFISIKEFIWFKLFKEYQVDYSIASATGLFNINSYLWDPGALKLGGMEASKLSDPVPTDFFRNDLDDGTAELLGVDPKLNFVIGASDGCLANVGSFALNAGRAAITIGTSGAVRVSSPKPILRFTSMTFNYVLDSKTFICGGPINNGGVSVDWVIRNFLGRGRATEADYAELFQVIQAVPPGSSGLVFLPYLLGERAPVWDAGAKGTFFGVQANHTQAHFCRAVLEGVCFALKQVLEILDDGEQPISQIQVGGGFTGSELWMQMLADITSKQVCVVHTHDASAIGAAYLGMKALDVISDYHTLAEPQGRHFSPESDLREVYQKNYNIFKGLYPKLKELMHL